MPVVAASLYEVILSVHIMAVVAAFGVTFAYPIIFAVGARLGARSLPLLHRIEYTIETRLINPALLVVVAAGIFLASDGHLWKTFFVQWGIGAAIVIGGLVGAVMIPTGKRAEEIARRDIEAGAGEHARSDVKAREQAGELAATDSERDLTTSEAPVVFSAEYRELVRRLSTVGTGLSLLVLVTIFFMALKL